jgi:L-alanine-DL-glutamate epimerase-like enolase superfamily enzyme
MTVVAIEPIVIALPFTHGGPATGFGGRDWQTLDYLLVRVVTDDGLVGWGEGFGYNAIPATRAALETMVAPLTIGTSETDIAAWHDRMERALVLFGRTGPVAYAVAAVDLALWDIAGKRAQQPLYELLGAPRRESVDAYASALSLATPSNVAAEAGRVARAGFRGLKLHDGAVDCVLSARSAAPELQLMVDVNCAWSVQEALAYAKAYEPAGLTWLEEPIWPPEDAASLGALRAAISTPVAAGENVATAAETIALSTTGRCDVLQPSVTKVGFTGARRMADAALASGARLAPHSPYLGPGLLATLQLAAVYPEIEWIEHLLVDMPASVFCAGVAIPDGEGRIAIPSAPGLGADPDAETLSKFRVT